MSCPIPYHPPKPGKSNWNFVTNLDKKASPQVSAALSALVDKYGSLEAAVEAGWQFVEPKGQQVSRSKASGPHHLIAPNQSKVLTSVQALDVIKAIRAPAKKKTREEDAPEAEVAGGRAKLPRTDTGAILAKWKAQRSFVRFLDGDKSNCAAANLQYISVKDGMAHFGEWVFDWDMDLTPKERKLVMDPEWRAGLTFTEV